MRALFLGGSYDMTTMELLKETNHFCLFKPEEPIIDWGHGKIPPSDPVLCKVLTYELITKTRKGVLIYEFVGDTK